jgi:hypothetical protein
MLAAAKVHLSSRGQLDTLTAHFEYLGRSAVGPAIVAIEDVKLTGQLSTLHLTLWQEGIVSESPWISPSTSRPIILAYTNHTDIRALGGYTLPTGYEATAAASLPPWPRFDLLKSKGVDEFWEEALQPKALRVWRSSRNWRFFLPRAGPSASGVLDMWVNLASGERITQSALPFVVDSFPHSLVTFLASSEIQKRMSAQKKPAKQAEKEDAGAPKGVAPERGQPSASWWCPTVALNLEVKALLPEEGVEWLAVRVTSKQIRNGRLDIESVVRDAGGGLVAIGHQVLMVVDMKRNMQRRHRTHKATL